MKPVCSSSQGRTAESKIFDGGATPISLMGKVGEAIADELKEYSKILFICGTGNNAGDGYAAASMLSCAKDITLLIVREKYSDAGLFYLNKCKKNHIKCIYGYKLVDFSQYDVIVDCLYGIGFHGELSVEEKQLINSVNNSNKKIISIDIPSGLEANTGIAKSAFKADLVLTIGCAKYGLYLNSGKDYCKKIKVIDLGFDIFDYAMIFDTVDCMEFLKPRLHNSHKGIYGYVSLFGGNKNYSGAIKLANLACSSLYSGCGVVRLVVPDEIFTAVAPYMLSSTLFSEKDSIEFLTRSAAIGIGCGWGRGGDRADLLNTIFSHAGCPIVLDADGLYAWKKLGLRKYNNLIITPHLSEMSHISDKSIEEIVLDPVGTAKSFSLIHHCITVLKGPTTIITDGMTVYLTDRGCPGMATAGSGDVLLGIMTSVVGQRFDNILKSVAYATFINGFAGELAQKKYTDIGMTSADTLEQIRPAILFLKKSCGIN